jgi:hypothetical protein
MDDVPGSTCGLFRPEHIMEIRDWNRVSAGLDDVRVASEVLVSLGTVGRIGGCFGR